MNKKNMSYEICIAKEEDIEEIAKLARQSGKLHQEKEPTFFRKCNLSNNSEYIKKVIEDEYAEVFKAYDENKKIVGYWTLYLHDCSKEFFVYPEFGYIGDLCVDENYRQQGIAQALISEAENYLQSRGIKSIELDVFTFNQKANNLYEKLGYRNLKYRKRKLL